MMADTGVAGFVPDPYSQTGRWRAPAEHAEVVVIGAGPAGLAAATEAARGGASVMLVDEHPVAGDLVGLDVPFFFGGRAGPAVGNKARMVEQVLLANPGLEDAFEAGVDVRLGTACWGAFMNGPGLRVLPVPVVGLADDDRSWLVSFDRLILATGARDLVFFFEGADQPGVMGALGFDALLRRYDAFEGRSVLILGTGELALDAAELAHSKGIAVAGLVEVRQGPQGDAARIEALRRRGVPIFAGHVILKAERGSFGVAAAVLAPADRRGPEVTVACDTVVLAVDRVPVVDLAEVVGARLAADGAKGGHVPVAGTALAGTTAEGVLVAGDCGGLVPREAAIRQGHAAARAALASLGRAAAVEQVAERAAPTEDRQPYRLDWMRALLETGSPEVLACQCEEVSRADLLGVRPPRYLGPASPRFEGRGLRSLAADGPIDQDQIKRLTRACMGACQARRCREQVAMMLAIGAGIGLEAIPLAGYRAPVRPLPLGVLADREEGEDMRAGWDVWFGIRTQWVPYADIGTEREAGFLGRNMHL